MKSKKILTACNEEGEVLQGTHFIVPVCLDNKHKFITIPHKENALYGAVVYTGKNIDEHIVYNKIISLGVKITCDENEQIDMLAHFLKEIQSKKIGTFLELGFSESGEMDIKEKIKKKEKSVFK